MVQALQPARMVHGAYQVWSLIRLACHRMPVPDELERSCSLYSEMYRLQRLLFRYLSMYHTISMSVCVINLYDYMNIYYPYRVMGRELSEALTLLFCGGELPACVRSARYDLLDEELPAPRSSLRVLPQCGQTPGVPLPGRPCRTLAEALVVRISISRVVFRAGCRLPLQDSSPARTGGSWMRVLRSAVRSSRLLSADVLS